MEVKPYSVDYKESQVLKDIQRESQKEEIDTFKTSLLNKTTLKSYIRVYASDLVFSHRTSTNMEKFLDFTRKSIKLRNFDDEIGAMLITLDEFVQFRLRNPKQTMKIEEIRERLNLILDSDRYLIIRDELIIPLCEDAKDLHFYEEIDEDLLQMTKNVEIDLKYNNIYSNFDKLNDLAFQVKNSSYYEKEENIGKFRDALSNILDFFRKTDNYNKKNKIKHTSDPSFVEELINTFETIISPSTALTTGWQALNDALGPRKGFINKQLYVFYANTNSFKSALLLHLARMIMMYNGEKFRESFEKTGKRPTVLVLQMENDNDEDNERLYKLIVKKNLGDCGSKNVLLDIWKSLFTDQNQENPIDISFMHVDARSLTVEDIDGIIDTLSDEGFEVIATIIDYLALIAPRRDDIGRDIRIQLQHISEDLLTLAKNRSIPVITAHQLNRAGGAILNANKQNGGSNAVSLLSNEYVGESYGIEQTVSWSAFIDIEYQNGKKWLTFKENKKRSRRNENEETDTFVMEIKDGIIIEDDIYLDKRLSYPRIPSLNPENNLNMFDQTTGRRGVIDIRDKKDETIEKIVENDNKKRKFEPKYLRSVQHWWFQYTSEVPIGYLTKSTTPLSPFDPDIEHITIGETEYIYLPNEFISLNGLEKETINSD